MGGDRHVAATSGGHRAGQLLQMPLRGRSVMFMVEVGKVWSDQTQVVVRYRNKAQEADFLTCNHPQPHQDMRTKPATDTQDLSRNGQNSLYEAWYCSAMETHSPI